MRRGPRRCAPTAGPAVGHVAERRAFSAGVGSTHAAPTSDHRDPLSLNPDHPSAWWDGAGDDSDPAAVDPAIPAGTLGWCAKRSWARSSTSCTVTRWQFLVGSNCPTVAWPMVNLRLLTLIGGDPVSPYPLKGSVMAQASGGPDLCDLRHGLGLLTLDTGAHQHRRVVCGTASANESCGNLFSCGLLDTGWPSFRGPAR